VHGILLAAHPGSNMGSDENSRRQDNKDKDGFLVIAKCACVSTPSRTFGYDCEHANNERKSGSSSVMKILTAHAKSPPPGLPLIRVS
jgi:hypothetical protein